MIALVVSNHQALNDACHFVDVEVPAAGWLTVLRWPHRSQALGDAYIVLLLQRPMSSDEEQGGLFDLAGQSYRANHDSNKRRKLMR